MGPRVRDCAVAGFVHSCPALLLLLRLLRLPPSRPVPSSVQLMGCCCCCWWCLCLCLQQWSFPRCCYCYYLPAPLLPPRQNWWPQGLLLRLHFFDDSLFSSWLRTLEELLHAVLHGEELHEEKQHEEEELLLLHTDLPHLGSIGSGRLRGGGGGACHTLGGADPRVWGCWWEQQQQWKGGCARTRSLTTDPRLSAMWGRLCWGRLLFLLLPPLLSPQPAPQCLS